MTAYDDLATPAQMRDDCRAAGRHLRLERISELALTSASPSLHFEDFPREVPKRDIAVSAAAQRIANALELHLD